MGTCVSAVCPLPLWRWRAPSFHFFLCYKQSHHCWLYQSSPHMLKGWLPHILVCALAIANEIIFYHISVAFLILGTAPSALLHAVDMNCWVLCCNLGVRQELILSSSYQLDTPEVQRWQVPHFSCIKVHACPLASSFHLLHYSRPSLTNLSCMLSHSSRHYFVHCVCWSLLLAQKPMLTLG